MYEFALFYYTFNARKHEKNYFTGVFFKNDIKIMKAECCVFRSL